MNCAFARQSSGELVFLRVWSVVILNDNLESLPLPQYTGVNPIPAMHIPNVTLYRKNGQKSEKNCAYVSKNL